MPAYPKPGAAGLHFSGLSPRKFATFLSSLLRVGGIAIGPHFLETLGCPVSVLRGSSLIEGKSPVTSQQKDWPVLFVAEITLCKQDRNPLERLMKAIPQASVLALPLVFTCLMLPVPFLS